MAVRSQLRKRLKDMRRSVRAQLKAARSRGHTSVDIAHRSNIVVTTNTGEPGSTQSASAHQEAEIKQGG